MTRAEKALSRVQTHWPRATLRDGKIVARGVSSAQQDALLRIVGRRNVSAVDWLGNGYAVIHLRGVKQDAKRPTGDGAGDKRGGATDPGPSSPKAAAGGAEAIEGPLLTRRDWERYELARYLMEHGRVPDPRVEAKAVDITQVSSLNSHFKGIARALTKREVDDALDRAWRQMVK